MKTKKHNKNFLDIYPIEVDKLTIKNDKLLERAILGICGEAGELVEVLKKFYRGDFETKELYKRLIKEAGDVLFYLTLLSNLLGVSLSEIAYINIQKLKDRKKRKKLQGDGDER